MVIEIYQVPSSSILMVHTKLLAALWMCWRRRLAERSPAHFGGLRRARDACDTRQWLMMVDQLVMGDQVDQVLIKLISWSIMNKQIVQRQLLRSDTRKASALCCHSKSGKNQPNYPISWPMRTPVSRLCRTVAASTTTPEKHAFGAANTPYRSDYRLDSPS